MTFCNVLKRSSPVIKLIVNRMPGRQHTEFSLWIDVFFLCFLILDMIEMLLLSPAAAAVAAVWGSTVPPIGSYRSREALHSDPESDSPVAV